MNECGCHKDTGLAGFSPAVIVCDIGGQAGAGPMQSLCVVNSPVVCLDRCIEQQPDLIVVCFELEPSKDRTYLLQLCAALKRNRYCRHCSVLVLLPSKHRQLLKELAEASVDYVWIEESPGLKHPDLPGLINYLSEKDRPERLLSPLCPFVHYARIAEDHEMTVCGAYLDRLVLAGKRLHDLCETEAHHQCEHFLRPRQKS